MPPPTTPSSHSTAVHFTKTASRCCANLVTWWSSTSSVNSSKLKTISCSSCVSRACLQTTCKCLRKESFSLPHVRHECNCYYCTTQPQQFTATKQPSLLFQASFLQSCKTDIIITFIGQRKKRSYFYHLVFCGDVLAKSLHFGFVICKMEAIVADISTGQGTPKNASVQKGD